MLPILQSSNSSETGDQVTLTLETVEIVYYYYVYVDTVFGLLWVLFFLLLGWMFEIDWFDTCCFGCHMKVFCIFVFAPAQRNCACFT